jgi:hypothetical protein
MEEERIVDDGDVRIGPWRRDVGWYWHLLEAELLERGHDVVAPDLPSAVSVDGYITGPHSAAPLFVLSHRPPPAPPVSSHEQVFITSTWER